MIRLAANLSTMFPEMGFLQRIAAAAQAGFKAVECQFPYAEKATAIAEQLQAQGQQCVLFNAPPGDLKAGERGIASLPGRERQFAESIDQAVEYLQVMQCRRLHVMAGLLPNEAERAARLEKFVENIGVAARKLALIGGTVMLEPINTRVDVPGYLLDSTALAVQCIERCGVKNVQLQYDLYHMQIMEQNDPNRIRQLLPQIGHVQVADVPGRHEPGTGQMDWNDLFEVLEESGYAGFIGCEYLPVGDTRTGLSWASKYLI